MTNSAGVDRGIVYTEDLYSQWVGLDSVKQDVENNIEFVYIDGNRSYSVAQNPSFDGTVVSFTYPDLIEEEYFDFSFRSFLGQSRTSYELHLLYQCKAKVSGVTHTTRSTLSNPGSFTVDIKTLPLPPPEQGFTNISHIIVRTDGLPKEAINELEDILYGEPPRMPSLEEVVEILESHASLRIINHGDGTWTARELKPIDAITMVSADEFVIDWHTSRYIDTETYKIHSG